jgi:hypothetical protein
MKNKELVSRNKNTIDNQISYLDRFTTSGFSRGAPDRIYIPTMIGDQGAISNQGANYMIYRICHNQNYEYHFDSIVPLKLLESYEMTYTKFLDILSMSDNKKKKLIEYSNKNNKLIEIKNIISDFENYIMITMACLNAHPLVPELTTYKNKSQKATEKLAKNFNKIIQNSQIFQSIYDHTVKVMFDLIEQTGYYLSDIAPNNILYNISDDIFDFKIIDLMDIRLYRESMEVDMARLFTLSKERLPLDFLRSLSKESLFFFPSRQERHSKKEYDKRMNDFFDNEIKRPRYVKFTKG